MYMLVCQSCNSADIEKFDNKEFVKVNENRHKDLKKWIHEYLEEEK